MNTALGKRFVAAVLFLTLTILSARAQVNGFHGDRIAPRGVPASVTSFGFGGHPGFHGVPASVTSLGFGASNNFHGVPGHVTSFGFDTRNGFHDRPFESRHHRVHRPFVVYSPYYSYVPYADPYYLNEDNYNQDDPAASASNYRDYDYRQDDNRKLLEEDYRAGLNPPQEQTSQQPSQPVIPQPSTVLVFKDGHQQEISNYAIVGATLYDLSDGRSKKLQLEDLDLTATIKENDQRGVEFQLPATTKLN
jgi:hypothetical protein